MKMSKKNFGFIFIDFNKEVSEQEVVEFFNDLYLDNKNFIQSMKASITRDKQFYSEIKSYVNQKSKKEVEELEEE